MLLKRGNLKLSSKIGIWTLPRSTCIGMGKECAKWCYGKKMEKIPSVQKSREWKLEQSKSPDFVLNMVAEIKKRKFSMVRIHEVGDYSNQAYLNRWFYIASLCPDTIFFTFTKAFSLLDFSGAPINFIIFQSYGSNHDEQIDYSKNTAKVVEKDYTPKEGEFVCPYGSSTFKKCGESCLICMSNPKEVKHIVFHKH